MPSVDVKWGREKAIRGEFLNCGRQQSCSNQILKLNLKRQNTIPAKQYMSAGLGAQSAALDKHLMLPRALQLSLQPPLTLEGTFHMKMCHNFAILQPFFNGPKGLSWFSQQTTRPKLVFLRSNPLGHKGLKLAHEGYIMQRKLMSDSPRAIVSNRNVLRLVQYFPPTGQADIKISQNNLRGYKPPIRTAKGTHL